MAGAEATAKNPANKTNDMTTFFMVSTLFQDHLGELRSR